MMRKALPTTVYIKLRTAMNRTTDKVALYNFNLSTFWRKVETIPRTSQIDKRPVSCPEIIEIVLVILNGCVIKLILVCYLFFDTILHKATSSKGVVISERISNLVPIPTSNNQNQIIVPHLFNLK